jgi:hypothetical protein
MVEYRINYKNNEIVVKPAEVEDWKDKTGYEAQITPKGCKTATSWNNYNNAAQALTFAKESVDKGEVPVERQSF